MTAEEADQWELASDPWAEGAAANAAIEMIGQLMGQLPDVQVAHDTRASTAERLMAMDRLHHQAAAGGAMGAMGGDAMAALLPPAPDRSRDGTKQVREPNRDTSAPLLSVSVPCQRRPPLLCALRPLLFQSL